MELSDYCTIGRNGMAWIDIDTDRKSCRNLHGMEAEYARMFIRRLSKKRRQKSSMKLLEAKDRCWRPLDVDGVMNVGKDCRRGMADEAMPLCGLWGGRDRKDKRERPCQERQGGDYTDLGVVTR